MIYQTANKEQIILTRYNVKHIDQLLFYLNALGDQSKSQFKPHPFDSQSIRNLLHYDQENIAYLGIEAASQQIIAYHLIKFGFVIHDQKRLLQYPIPFKEEEVCTYAPSVAEQWQGKGIARSLFHFISNDIKSLGFKNMVLWGGVQTNNTKAVEFYKNIGFSALGNFEYQGSNLDMYFTF